jgi:UDP-2,4-diacetamido-2,4,6-trideoxy-beta-L-altropyranose hydrolase
MQVAIRTDASLKIGSGHVIRCLALAERLRVQGADVLFICRELVGNLNDIITDRGFGLCCLPAPLDENFALIWNQHAAWLQVHWQNDADETSVCLKKWEKIDWLIIDHYALERNWEYQQRSLVSKIMVIDDLADRSHDCDVLLDQNLHDNLENRYKILIPANCVELLGPKYALLRSEFIEARNHLHKRNGIIQRILIFFGGVDVHDLTSKVIKIIQQMNIQQITIDVVVGGQNQHRKRIVALCEEMTNAQCYFQISNMSELMSAADLAVGGAGSMVWERCFLGLPAIIFSMAENQIENAEKISERGAAYYMGPAICFDCKKFTDILFSFLDKPNFILEMSRSAFSVMEDYQGIDAIIKNIL